MAQILEASPREPGYQCMTEPVAERVPLIPRPIRDQILVRQDPAKYFSDSGIAFPAGCEEYPDIGTIVAVGPGLAEADGRRTWMDPDLVPGARVIFKRRAATALIWDRRLIDFSPPEFKDLVMLLPDDIHLVIVDDGPQASG